MCEQEPTRTESYLQFLPWSIGVKVLFTAVGNVSHRSVYACGGYQTVTYVAYHLILAMLWSGPTHVSTLFVFEPNWPANSCSVQWSVNQVTEKLNPSVEVSK